MIQWKGSIENILDVLIDSFIDGFNDEFANGSSNNYFEEYDDIFVNGLDDGNSDVVFVDASILNLYSLIVSVLKPFQLRKRIKMMDALNLKESLLRNLYSWGIDHAGNEE